MTREAIFEEALKLDPDDRADLIDSLLCSFGDGKDDVRLTPAQHRDLQMRLAEHESGKSNPIPLDDAIKRLQGGR